MICFVQQMEIVKFHGLAQFGFKHLIATNLCLWLRTLIREIVEELEYHNHSTDDSYNQTMTTVATHDATDSLADNHGTVSINLCINILSVVSFLSGFNLQTTGTIQQFFYRHNLNSGMSIIGVCIQWLALKKLAKTSWAGLLLGIFIRWKLCTPAPVKSISISSSLFNPKTRE